jgi:aminopeptidase-like protein
MLINHEPIGFQHSMQGNARIDRIVKNVLTSHTETHIETPYRELWGNDEMFYNGPGFHVPVIGLGRGMHREYHYDTDNFENIDKYHMVESAWFIMRMIEVFETDYVPVRTFDGPLYLSRYGLYVDPTIAREAARKVERMQALIDGERSVMDIADKLDLDYFFVRDFCDQLAEKGLIEKRPRDPRAGDQGTM